MLPKDLKKRHQDVIDAAEQSTVALHFKDVPKVQPYSGQLMKDAAIEWLIQTNQVHLLHINMKISKLIINL